MVHGTLSPFPENEAQMLLIEADAHALETVQPKPEWFSSGPVWALALYAIDIAIIFVLGRIALKIVPGQSTGLIMEIHSFKIPSLAVVSRQTWARTKSLIYIVFPIYIAGSGLVQMLFAIGVLKPVSDIFSPFTVGWLGLAAITGIPLILGLVRKEFILLASVAVFGSTNLGLFLTNIQLLTLALIGMLYIPCLSTIATLAKEFGWKATITISAANLATALAVGGLAARLPLPSGVTPECLNEAYVCF
jgi:ferrous iron transport protein B